MSIWQAVLLGLIQGVTEFLPVSSSGHLVLAQYFLGFQESQLLFDVAVHFSTLFAVVIFFWPVLIRLRFKEWFIIGVGTIPAAIVGVFFKDTIELLFAAPIYVAVAMLITAGINFWADRKLEAEKTEKKSIQLVEKEEMVSRVGSISWLQAIIVGLFQAVAISPGISRSGSTLAGGLSQKLDRQTAFTFSFLLSVPAVAGATVLQVLDVLETGQLSQDWTILLIGGLAAFISGYASLWWFKKIVSTARLEVFGWYCLVVGIGSLAIMLWT